MLRIRKEIRNPDGTTTEIEGTEAEVEAYERKNEKKKQTEQAKKERKLLLDSARTLDKMTKKDLVELIQKTLAEQATKEIHHYHWYYNNGYWWKPDGDGRAWVYLTTNTNPNLGQWYTTVGSSIPAGGTYLTQGLNSNTLNDGHVVTCNSIDELTRSTGIGAEAVYASMLAGETAVPTVGVYNASITAAGAADQGVQGTNGLDLYRSAITTVTAEPITSGIIDMNMRS